MLFSHFEKTRAPLSIEHKRKISEALKQKKRKPLSPEAHQAIGGVTALLTGGKEKKAERGAEVGAKLAGGRAIGSVLGGYVAGKGGLKKVGRAWQEASKKYAGGKGPGLVSDVVAAIGKKTKNPKLEKLAREYLTRKKIGTAGATAGKLAEGLHRHVEVEGVSKQSLMDKLGYLKEKILGEKKKTFLPGLHVKISAQKSFYQNEINKALSFIDETSSQEDLEKALTYIDNAMAYLGNLNLLEKSILEV